jgi:drug/metabolite transporter (DMT)-like permease
MAVFKSSNEEFSSSSPSERITKLKWWFIILIILGVLALILVWFSQGEKATIEFQKLELPSTVTSIAYAQPDEPEKPEKFTPRVIIMGGVFVILGLVYLAGIFKLFFSRNSTQLDTAADLVKTLTGFFVGVATSFIGA